MKQNYMIYGLEVKHMFICGNNFCGGALACAYTPSAIENINYVELKHGLYDDLYLSNSTDFELTNRCPEAWDFDTALYAKFNNNTNAGNVDWNLETVSDLALKCRVKGNFKWKTIKTKEIHSIDDFKIDYNDYLVASNETIEYAIVPVLYGLEGNYAVTQAIPIFNRMFLIEGNTVYSTDITDGFCDTTRNIPASTVELLNSKYPIFIRNTIANYDTGSCSGSFVPVSADDDCTLLLDSENDYERISYQRDVMDFITNGIPKVLKLSDGRIWIIQVMPNPTDTADQLYNNRKISFQWVEIGDVNSEEDLYYLGLSDVSEEWWNK